MCINATPNWTRIRHWSAPENRTKGSGCYYGLEEEDESCMGERSKSFLDLRQGLLQEEPLPPLSYSVLKERKIRERRVIQGPSISHTRTELSIPHERVVVGGEGGGDPLRGSDSPPPLLLPHSFLSGEEESFSNTTCSESARPHREYSRKRGFWKTFFKFYNRGKFKTEWSISGVANFLLLLLMIIPIQSELCGDTRIVMMGNPEKEFKVLENCTIIEGFLILTELADLEPSKNYRQLSFPKLREITDYFIIYQANAIESLGQMFPNLTVIRGNDLVMNYAFVIYLCQNIYEVGLRSLTHILRGGVRIEDNPRLCYANTIDWKAIVHGNDEFIRVVRNEDPNVCVDYCREDCPLLKGTAMRRACWTKDYCQRVQIPCEEGRTCYLGNDGNRGSIEKCSKECLGGCYGPTQEECFSCKNFLWESDNKNYCRTMCPSPFLVYNGWRCIGSDQCRKKRYFVNRQRINEEMKYRIYNDSCIKDCPSGTQQIVDKKTGDLTCEKCDFCPKICSGGPIRSLDDLHKFTECTHIDGDLNIRVRGKNIVNELEKSLGKIVNISGSLKITRTFSIVSLDFFKELRYIEGIHDVVKENYYSLSILENENIQTLFPFNLETNRRVVITQQEQRKDENGNIISGPKQPGRAFIHYNPKLCLSKIKEMIKESRLDTKYDEVDISEYTNGDKAICSHFKLNISVNNMGPGFYITFDNYQKIIFEEDPTNDIRALLRYEIHYRIVDKATFLKKNLTQFEGRDACGGGHWNIHDKIPTEPHYENTNLVFKRENEFIPHKNPYTYYAIYVTTLMIRDIANRHNIKGAQSDIVYILTPESKPSKPLKVTTKKISHSSVEIVWQPPNQPNGIIDNYELNITREILDHTRIMERPYCQDMYKIKEEGFEELLDIEKEKTEEEKKKPTSVLQNLTMCDCEMCKTPNLIQTEDEKSEVDDFHGQVLNVVFVSKSPGNSAENEEEEKEGDGEKSSRDKRAISGDLKANELDRGATKRVPFMVNKIIPGSSASFIAKGLRHYGSYTVTLRACHKESLDLKSENRCSDDVIVYLKVLNKPGADDILGSPVIVPHNSSSEIVWLRWNPPKDPNELIVNYNIRIESKSKESTGIYCVTANDFIKNDYRYHLPVPGAYYVSVQAVSIFGPGKWSERTWVTVKGHSSSIILYVMIPVVFILIVIAAAIFGFFYFKKMRDGGELFVSSNPRYISTNTVYRADEWEVPRSSVELLEELGDGCFGMVHRGIFTGVDKVLRPCAVKTVKKRATHLETMTFLIEATVMKKFNTTHVVKLLGVVSDGQPHMVILEMMEKGDLRKYLISRRPENTTDGKPPPTVREIYQMAIEITDGMAYIAKQRVVHGDLAARNCMISDKLVVKIGDFGLSHDIYTKGYFRKGDKGMMPVRWMSPEGLRDGVYSPMTDVWSFGIVLWEMVTLGENPYQGLSNDQVYRFIVNRNIMAEPKNCPPSIYALMKDCWRYSPVERPTFLDLCQRLLPHANDRFKTESFITSAEGQAALEAQEQERAMQRSERANRLKEVEENAETPLTYPNGGSSSGGSINVTFAGGYPPSTNSDSNGVLAATNVSSSSAISNGHLLSSIPSTDFRELNRPSLFGGGGGNGGSGTGSTATARITSTWNKMTSGFMRIRNKSGSASGEA